MNNEQKLFYTIGEAAQIVNVKPYVLRYWETEFKKLNPQKSVTGQRVYRKKDINIALTIKKLLYEEKFTIAGANQRLQEMDKEGVDWTALGTHIPVAQKKEESLISMVSEAVAAPVEPKTEPIAVPAQVKLAEEVLTEPAKMEFVPMLPTKVPTEDRMAKIRELKQLIASTESILKKYN